MSGRFSFALFALLWIGSESNENRTCRGRLEDGDYFYVPLRPVCVYMLDISPGGNWCFHENRISSPFEVQFEELEPDADWREFPSVFMGKAFWSLEEGGRTRTIDVFYIAHAAFPNSSIENDAFLFPEEIDFNLFSEYLLMKQYITASFINCIPQNDDDKFSCFWGGGFGDRGIQLKRKIKTARCRTSEGYLEPIVLGLDLCAFQFTVYNPTSISVGLPMISRLLNEEKRSNANVELSYTKTRAPHEFCKLYRQGGRSLDKLTGIGDRQCVKRVGVNVYDIVCCFYAKEDDKGNHRPFVELQAKLDPSSNLTFCAATPERGGVRWKINKGVVKPFEMISEETSWEHLLKYSFFRLCYNTVSYRFYKNDTAEIFQETYGTTYGAGECEESSCTVATSIIRNCPFAPFSGSDFFESQCCCSGRNMCNKLEKEFYGLTKKDADLQIEPHCSRQSVGDSYDIADSTTYVSYPQLTVFCEKSTDVESGAELNLLRTSGVVRRSTLTQNYEYRYNRKNGNYACQLVEAEVPVELENFGGYCKHMDRNQFNFVEKLRRKIPWNLFVCYCMTSPNATDFCDSKDSLNVASAYQEFPSFIDCYKYGDAEKGIPIQSRNLKKNRQSIRCYVEISEDVDQDLTVQAGLFTTSKAIEAFNANLFYPGNETFNCNHSNGSTLCHCLGDKCNDASFRAEVVRRHVETASLSRAEWLQSRTRRCSVHGVKIKCHKDRKEFNPEPLGCFIERPLTTITFEGKCVTGLDVEAKGTNNEEFCRESLKRSSGKVAYCRYSERSESIFCCCRETEDCGELRDTYRRVGLN
ncbi:hypothetical protein L596_024839 [Steinernema carpocapsae]|nr:hypothetical protein L596_024839 [Steinernema carpocapsae]